MLLVDNDAFTVDFKIKNRLFQPLNLFVEWRDGDWWLQRDFQGILGLYQKNHVGKIFDSPLAL